MFNDLGYSEQLENESKSGPRKILVMDKEFIGGMMQMEDSVWDKFSKNYDVTLGSDLENLRDDSPEKYWLEQMKGARDKFMKLDQPNSIWSQEEMERFHQLTDEQLLAFSHIANTGDTDVVSRGLSQNSRNLQTLLGLARVSDVQGEALNERIERGRQDLINEHNERESQRSRRVPQREPRISKQDAFRRMLQNEGQNLMKDGVRIHHDDHPIEDFVDNMARKKEITPDEWYTSKSRLEDISYGENGLVETDVNGRETPLPVPSSKETHQMLEIGRNRQKARELDENTTQKRRHRAMRLDPETQKELQSNIKNKKLDMENVDEELQSKPSKKIMRNKKNFGQDLNNS